MHNPAAAGAPTPRTRVKRGERARYDRSALDAILDEALVCHVAFLREGAPSVIPMLYARWGDALYLHGSTANRALRAVAAGDEVCVEVALLDGLVLARSAFHTSVNYRSAMLYARGAPVADPAERLEALRRIVEKACPGRWADVRPPSREELLRTLVVKLPLDEASAKVRAGDPLDDEPDHALGCWAGQLPLRLVAGEPVADARLRAGIEPPAYLRAWRPGASGADG
jgi:nitroimidazol reductase NimA-like FMN-containing flavoprotein (pyridoxamine 5'-phosphate oxidase superfamily)